MNVNSFSDDARALRLLLGDMPVITPDTLAAFGGWMLAKMKEFDKTTPAGGQVWARPSQIAARFGVKRAQVAAWLSRLVEAGKVRRWQPETARGTAGDTYYNIADLENVWKLERK